MAAYQIISIHVSVRRRTQRNQTSFSTKLISTHVSARERTPSFKYSLNALSVLKLTSPQGDEHKIPLPPQVDRNFNSRLRKETNRNTAPVSRAWKYFNSRLRKETNLKEIVDSGFSIISIHVSARRRTPKKTTESCSCLFQFTSPYGDEPVNSKKDTIRIQISIHVFVVRRTQQSYHFPAYAKISIHVSARRRTCNLLRI